jgi:carbamoyl-phosphate synthase large subunit
MPKRIDIQRVLIIGSGPIVIGQACEFDYSGAQACKTLREEGISVVLVNSNPATIMTDPEMADRTYIEPVTPEVIEKIIIAEHERATPIDSLLPTLGGQTGLNCAMAAHASGVLERHGVRMLAASPEAINKAEDRTAFKEAAQKIGLDVPSSRVVRNWQEAKEAMEFVGLPCALRPAFTLGGTGGGFAHTPAEFESLAKRGLRYSPISQVLIEESLWGWKEYELEVMRDRADNVVIICGIENFDPMGVHTGDSITVAPIQTLTDKEYQRMRDAAIAMIREIGVETGGANIQFGVNPRTGRMCIIEMNPRVSRSSALASKATGFPIAKIATKLAIGYTLDEIPNDITRTTPACFEPAIDYCVVKIPRWTFEKFPEADETLTTQMKSVGEAMAIGRTFKEALQKCIRSMEIKRFGLGLDDFDKWLKWKRTQLVGAGGAGFQPAGERPPAGAPALVGAELATVGAPSTAAAIAAGETGASVVAGSRAGEPPADEAEERANRWPLPMEVLTEKLRVPAQGRLYYIRYALKHGWTVPRVAELSGIDPWFLENIRQLIEFEQVLFEAAPTVKLELGSLKSEVKTDGAPSAFEESVSGCAAGLDELLLKSKQWGYSDYQLSRIWNTTPDDIAALRRAANIEPVYKLVDTCAAEFEAATPYYYSTYERSPITLNPADSNPRRKSGVRAEDEIRVTGKQKVVVLGGGPNRIGQGIEFDYCCVHAAMAARELGYEAVMINSNPETVSTDYDTSDLLFFEPLTLEDVVNICERLNGRPLPGGQDARPTLSNATPARPWVGQASSPPRPWVGQASSLPPGNEGGLLRGVICQFGGQTPLNLAMGLQRAGVPIIGTSPRSIHMAEDREQFTEVLRDLGLQQPESGIARTFDQARRIGERIGYPVLVRPSFVLGGRAMEICNSPADLRYYMTHATEASGEHPVLVDRFLSDAVEVDLDAVCDGKSVVICGIMEHIEHAGVHSGDSAMSLPPNSLSAAVVAQIRFAATKLAMRLGVIGLMNVQFAIKDEDIYVLEVNPRASRTVPFVAKATGVPWARIAAKVMLGHSLREMGVTEVSARRHIAVKQSVFPFNKFPGVDVALGPEMRSTGEVMGVDEKFSIAFAKGLMAAGIDLPMSGKVFVSVNVNDRPMIPPIARELARMGYELVCTEGTARTLQAAGLKADVVRKIRETAPDGSDAAANEPNPLTLIESGQIALVINTPGRTGRLTDEGRIRAAAAIHRVPIFTTIPAARAAVAAIGALKRRSWNVVAIQDLWT